MGRQINFFMTAQDEEFFLRSVVQGADLLLLSGAPLVRPEPVLLPELPDLLEPYGWSVYLVPSGFVGDLEYRSISNLGQYRIDQVVAPVVEFVRSQVKVSERTISRGRLWVELQSFDPSGRPAPKPGDLGRHFERLARFVRREYRKEGFFYIGPGVDKLLAEGFRLQTL